MGEMKPFRQENFIYIKNEIPLILSKTFASLRLCGEEKA
jgi:hypothetical protein